MGTVSTKIAPSIYTVEKHENERKNEGTEGTVQVVKVVKVVNPDNPHDTEALKMFTSMSLI